MSIPAEHECELPSETCWPLIAGALNIVIVGGIVAFTVLLADVFEPLRPPASLAVPQAQVAVPLVANLDRGPDSFGDTLVADAPRSQRAKAVDWYAPWAAASKGGDIYYCYCMRGRPASQLARDVDSTESLSQPNEPPPPPVFAFRVPAAPRNPRLVGKDEKALDALLRGHSVEVDLESSAGAASTLLQAATALAKQRAKTADEKPSFSLPMESLLANRIDLRGLPLRRGKSCESSKEDVVIFHKMAVIVRTGQTAPALYEPEQMVRALEQLCQADPVESRQKMIPALAKIPTTDAAEALARRAVFDLSPDIRAAAIEVLMDHNAEAAREVFLAAFRHPWPEAGDHAAAALVMLNDTDAVPALKRQLDLPAPTDPVKDDRGAWHRKELVRVNHLRNCLLCHPPSLDENDPLRGMVPVPGEVIPDGIPYYGPKPGTQLVRGDVVFLRQDFSVMHKVDNPDKWPEMQRFDYLVRDRALSATEAKAALAQATGRKT